MKLPVDACVFIDAFDLQSPDHAESLALLDDLRRLAILIITHALGWFEVHCALQGSNPVERNRLLPQ